MTGTSNPISPPTYKIHQDYCATSGDALQFSSDSPIADPFSSSSDVLSDNNKSWRGERAATGWQINGDIGNRPSIS
jgi:hypothetical protein